MKQKGFTLAEVLITLGIIGVVAAMTMPGLIQNYQKKVTATKLKKFYSTMNQAIKLSEVENGSCEFWNFPEESDEQDEVNQLKLLNEFYNKYLFKYLNNINIVNLDDYPLQLIEFSDGTKAYITAYKNGINGITWDITYFINNKHIKTINDFLILSEINSSPKNMFQFSIYSTDYVKNSQVGSNNPPQRKKCMLDAYAHWGGMQIFDNRQSLIEVCHYQQAACTKLIMTDGWEIKNDYPWDLKEFHND